MSETRRIKLEDATRAQLATFASTVLGIDCDADDTAPQILAKIKPAYSRSTFDLSEDDAAAGERRPMTPDEAMKTGRKMLKIRIPSTDQVGGKEPVPVSVNGRAMYIPRDEDVDVPAEYVEVLKNAKFKVYDHHSERGLINGRDALRHPVQVIG